MVGRARSEALRNYLHGYWEHDGSREENPEPKTPAVSRKLVERCWRYVEQVPEMPGV
jgi:hypothetical protein